MKKDECFIDASQSLINRKKFVVDLVRELGFNVNNIIDLNLTKMVFELEGFECYVTVGKLISAEQADGPCGGKVVFKLTKLIEQDGSGLNMATIRVNCNINKIHLKDRLEMLVKRCRNL